MNPGCYRRKQLNYRKEASCQREIILELDPFHPVRTLPPFAVEILPWWVFLPIDRKRQAKMEDTLVVKCS